MVVQITLKGDLIEHYTRIREMLDDARIRTTQFGNNELVEFGPLSGWVSIDGLTAAPGQAVAWIPDSEWRYRTPADAFSDPQEAMVDARAALSRKLEENAAAMRPGIDEYLERVGAGPRKPDERSDPDELSM